jgi:hypothetical protein
LYTVKEKGGKSDTNPYPLPYGLRNPIQNLKSENSQDYTQKPQQNCTFMNSASVFAPNAYRSILYDIIQVDTADAVHSYLSKEIHTVVREKLYTVKQDFIINHHNLFNPVLRIRIRRIRMFLKRYCDEKIKG